MSNNNDTNSQTKTTQTGRCIPPPCGRKSLGTCLATHLSNCMWRSLAEQASIADKKNRLDLTQYSARSQVIGDALKKLSSDQQIGDWIQLPDGTTYTLTFKA